MTAHAVRVIKFLVDPPALSDSDYDLAIKAAYFTPEELPNNKYYIFGKEGGKSLASEKNIPFLGQIPLIQEIREIRGISLNFTTCVVTDAFDSIAMKLAQQVAIRNANGDQQPTQVVEKR